MAGVIKRYTFQIMRASGYRVKSLVFLVMVTYVGFHIQQDIRFVLNNPKSIGIMAFKSTTTTEQRITTNTPHTQKRDNSTRNTTQIYYPLDIDLETYVKETLENNFHIPDEPINVHHYHVVHSPPDCVFDNSTVRLLVLVKSSAKNIILRNAIRESWGTESGASVKIVFMLGHSEILKENTKAEAEPYNDVIMENFVDAYANNTLKTIMGFTWAVTNCTTANVILFIDDDHLPHMRNIRTYLNSLNLTQIDALYSGYRLNKAFVYRGKHHWGIPKKDYPYPHWPPYLRGGAFLISQKLAQKFVIAFPYVKFLHVDDTYLGLVAMKLNISPQHDARFYMTMQKIRSHKSYFVYNDYKIPQILKQHWTFLANGK